jgi:hypothetical protein
MIRKDVLVAAVAAAGFTGGAYANPTFLNGGPSLTNGGVSQPHSLLSATFNPAASSLVVTKDRPFRIGILPSFGFGVELGQADSFVDRIDQLADDLDKEDVTQEDADKAIADWDEIREVIGEEGYFKLYAGGQVPLMPVAWYLDGFGTVTLDVSYNLEVKAIVLDDQLTYNDVEDTLETNTAMYLKSAGMVQAALGLSRELNTEKFPIKIPGTVTWGTRLNIYSAQMSKQVIALSDTDEEISDVAADNYENGAVTSTSFGVDAGLLWELPRSRVGLYVKNLIEPSFDYGPIGTGCNELSGKAQSDCFNAQYFSDEIALKETHTQNTQFTLEGSGYLGDSNLSLSLAYDINAVASPVGDEFQWVTGSVSYYPHRFYIPGVRAGVRKNLSGNELTMASLGFSFFRRINLDIQMALDTVEDDGSEAPRSVAFALGIETAL